MSGPTFKQRLHAFRFPAAQVHAPAISGQMDISAALAASSSLRRRPTAIHPLEQSPSRGMWVTLKDGRVGILKALDVGDTALVAVVDEFGANATEVIQQAGKPVIRSVELLLPAKDLRQAHRSEIPGPRRPDQKTAERMGYT